jgi:ferrous iron transport protein B
MQCISTIAVVRRETGGWKWPILQFTYMGVLAYIGSFVAFHVLR